MSETDREVWAKHIKDWYTAPLTKEQKEEIDNMDEIELGYYVTSMQGSNAQRNYATARKLSTSDIHEIREWE